MRPLTAATRAAIWVLLRLIPPARYAVVHGWPDDEGNAIETLRGLRRRYPHQVYWLLDDAGYSGPAFAAAALSDVVRVPKSSFRALWLSMRAEAVFFTHGLFTAVVPPGNRLVVNLWHGDGPKRLTRTRVVRSTVAISGSQLWSHYKAEVFDLEPKAVAVVGNPRTDQLFEAVPDPARQALGLARPDPLVVWLPTFRAAAAPRGVTWSDGEELTGQTGSKAFALALVETAERLGLRVVVKPHPLDADRYGDLGLRVLTNADLAAAGVSLYQLLGLSAALISDISSVWVDYLVLDRPVGFYMPDLAELERRRGLVTPNFADLVPGARVESPEGATAFLEAVAAGTVEERPSAYAGYPAIGVPAAPGVTDRMLDWLDEYEIARGRRARFSKRLRA